MTDYSKITALYSRLSVGDEDRDGGESNSIQNQKIFLENYARGQHLTNIRHYIDDDESGRFFDRSAYSRMMDDVENGKIGVCIMKDLTRWGRDYLQVGNAMEIFRRNNVRFIAVNNGIDSEKPDTLGSIDFRAAARSVLLIGRVKREPNVRVIVHDKSSLAPEGKPVAFCLDPETGFSWIGEYDITADELLSGAGGNTATKTEQAERLILDLLADGKELASEDIVKAAAEAGISERTVQNAKRNMGGILGARRVGGQWYNFIKKKQPPEPAS